MKKLLSVLLLLTSAVFAQQPQPLYNVYIPGITSTRIIDNRSASTMRLTTVQIACSGSGSWSADLSYGSTSTGSFTPYSGVSSVSNSSSSPVAEGFLLNYPNYIKVTISGTVTCNLSGFNRLYSQTSVPGSGTVTQVTIQGTTGQITVSGTCSITDSGTCVLSVPSNFILPGTINKLTLTQPATGATFTIADGKTVTVSNTLTFNGSDGYIITFPATGTVAMLGTNNVFTGRQDMSTASSTAPAKTGLALPLTCTLGDQFFLTSATSGQNLYGCTATNVWTQQAGSGGAPGFNSITNGTNTTAAMVIGTGASLSTTGSGSIAATTAAALAANPTDCSAGQYATTIAANGNLTCAQVAYSQLSGTPTLYYQTIQDEGGSLTQRGTINFTGSGVTCSDNSGQSRTDCTISGSLSSTAFNDITSGTNITATMVCGNGCALSATGTGTISATQANRLAANGSNCSSGQFAQGVDAQGNSEGCTALPTTLTGTTNQIAVSAPTGAIVISIPTNPTLPGTTTGTFSGPLTGNASTATALAANPSDCTAGQYATTIAANGDLTCAQVAYSQISGTPTLYNQTIADEGVALTQRPTVNFIGSGVTCSDNTGQSRTDCTVSGGGGGSSAFNDITSGTNASAAMVVGTGASLSASGSGTISATTAIALAANGTNCSSGSFATGVDANGNSEGCTALPTTLAGTANQISVSASTGAITIGIPNNPTLPGTTTGTFSGSLSGNATTATALAANPSDCTAGQYATTIAANGNLTCAQVSYTEVSGTPTIAETVTTTYSATPTFTVTSKATTSFKLTLTGNVSSSTLSGAVTGQIIIHEICQDGTGGRTFAWPANYVGTGTVDSTANLCTVQAFRYDGTNATAFTVPWVRNATTSKLTLTCGTAPGTPSSGTVSQYCTSGVPLWKDDAGNVYNAVIGTTATSNQFLTNITAAGVQTKAQPAFSNLSGTSTAAQTATSVLDDSVAYCADAGSNDTYACSLSPAPASYTTGGRYRFKANTPNTGAATINFNSLGAKTIKSVAGGVTTDLSDNQIRVGQVVELVYDGTNMQMISPTGNQITRALSFTFGDPAGSALSAGSTTTVYIAVPFSCTVAAWNILVDGGTATVKFWKKASGTAIPTSSDSINTSGVSISTGTAVRSTTLSDFTTTSISANDILAANITTVSSSKYLNATLECNQ